jgi:hypothetical protein
MIRDNRVVDTTIILINVKERSGEECDGDAAPDKGGFYSNTLSKIDLARENSSDRSGSCSCGGREVGANVCTNLFGRSPCHHAQNHAPKDAHYTNKRYLPVFTNQAKHDHLCWNPKD